MRGALACLALVLCSAVTQAQESGNSAAISTARPAPEWTGSTTGAAKFLARDFLSDQKQIWTRPLHVTRHQADLLVPFAVITAALIATDRFSSGELPNTADQIGTSGAVSRIGAAYTTISLASGFYIVGRISGNEHAEETGLLGLEALADTAALGGVLKYAFRRERPFQNDGRGRFWKGGTSFPSGHALMSWGLAQVIANEYREKPMVGMGAYTLATLVSLSRVSARKHFFSDVFAGAAGGILIGRYVYHAHHEVNRGAALLRPAIQPVFVPAVGGAGIRLAWGF